jgi:hypothetical protein
MDRIEGSQGVDPQTVMVGNYIRTRPEEPWMKVIEIDEFINPEGVQIGRRRGGQHGPAFITPAAPEPTMTFYGPDDEEITWPIEDMQIDVKTERVPADQIRKDDTVQHPESGDWVTLYNIAPGELGTRTAAVQRKSLTLTFYYEEDSSGNAGEFDSYIEIPGEEPALRTPKNPFIWRLVRDT